MNRIKPFDSIVNILFFITLLFTSCSYSKKFTYLRDISSEGQQSLPLKPTIHILKPNDNLYISILTTNPDMNKLYNPAVANSNQPIFNDAASRFINGYEIDFDGNINLPSLGKIMIAGKTINEAQALIELAAKRFLKEVTVKVRLLNYKVTVIGEVKSPGVYYNYDYNFNVMDAIGMASGITDVASLDNVLILRPSIKGSKIYTLNLNSKAALVSEAFYLEPNDILMVQPNKHKNYQQEIPLISSITAAIASALIYILLRK